MQTIPHISGPLTLGELLDRAFRMYRAKFGVLVLTAAIFWIPYGILSGLVTGSATVGYFELLSQTLNDPTFGADPAPFETVDPLVNFTGAAALSGLLGLLIQIIVILGLTNQHIAILHGDELSLGEGIRQGLRRFWPYLGMVIAKYVFIGLAALAVYIVFACAVFALAFGGAGLAGALFDGTPSGPEAAGFVGLFVLFACMALVAFALIFTPVAYLWARWIATAPGLVAEEWGPIEALRRSWALTRGQVWRCVGYSILLFILNIVIVSVPAVIIQQIALGLTALSPDSVAPIMGAATGVSALFNVIWQPFFVAALVLLYFDLRVRQEGYDLQVRIQQMEMEQASDAATNPSPRAMAAESTSARGAQTDAVRDDSSSPHTDTAPHAADGDDVDNADSSAKDTV